MKKARFWQERVCSPRYRYPLFLRPPHVSFHCTLSLCPAHMPGCHRVKCLLDSCCRRSTRTTVGRGKGWSLRVDLGRPCCVSERLVARGESEVRCSSTLSRGTRQCSRVLGVYFSVICGRSMCTRTDLGSEPCSAQFTRLVVMRGLEARSRGMHCKVVRWWSSFCALEFVWFCYQAMFLKSTRDSHANLCVLLMRRSVTR